MRSRFAHLAASSVAVLALLAPAPAPAVAQPVANPPQPTAACTVLDGAAAAGSSVDSLTLLTCIGQAVMNQKSVHVTLTGDLPGEAWIDYRGALKVMAKLGDGTQVLILPNGAFAKVPGVTKGWMKAKAKSKRPAERELASVVAQVRKQVDDLDTDALLAALQPCATMTSSGAVAGGIAVACPTALALPIMGMTLNVKTFQLVVDPATYLPNSVSIDVALDGASLSEQAALDWNSTLNWGKVRSQVRGQIAKAGR